MIDVHHYSVSLPFKVERVNVYFNDANNQVTVAGEFGDQAVSLVIFEPLDPDWKVEAVLLTPYLVGITAKYAGRVIPARKIEPGDNANA